MASSSYRDRSPIGVFITKFMLSFFIPSTMFGRPSPTLKIGSTGIPFRLNSLAVPEVANITNPIS